ncbi:DUF6044 family protein [Sulfuricurvum sp.]|uniref:DUF6044 family protein n=1 Tax=Sulfuricurvum sp. TaxID=2025608 RepID=UPI002E37E50B|nr:DUF6044 family protein [Sulfuricurvum sp.]HEX5329319.1 DUF6044 family protein [Sulfuricurvum sp.]
MIKKLEFYFYKNFINSHSFYLIIAFLMLEIYLFPLYYFGQDCQVKSFDNLDIVFPTLKTLVHSGKIFALSSEIIPNMMGGLPRLVYGTEFNVYVWLFYFFPPFIAYTINETLIHFGAFASMLILLNRYFVPKYHHYRLLIIYGVSIMFALAPFYTGAGLSIPSIPLALFVFLNFRNAIQRWYDWLFIVLIPFYSSLVLTYFFFLLLASWVWAFDTIRNRSVNWHYFGAMVLMSVMFVLVEYRLFYDTFIQHLFISHRTEFALFQSNTLFETYRSAHQTFLNGTTDMDTRASAVIVPFIALVLASIFVRKRLSWYMSFIVIGSFLMWILFPNFVEVILGNRYVIPSLIILLSGLMVFKKQYRAFAATVMIVLIFSFWHGFWFYEGTGKLSQTIHILREFNFARIALLQMAVWMIAVALGFVIITRKIRFAPILIIGVVLFHSYVMLNIRPYKASDSPFTYRAYFAKDVFDKIKAFIGKDPSTYRVGSIGFEPAISIYNGLYTIDGYVTSYPLEYKYRFYEITKNSLSTDEGNRKLFLGWGSKCYLFDGGESSLYFRPEATVKKLSLNFEAYKAVGGDYLLSTHRIEASQMKHLVFLSEFSGKDTFWKFYLYRVDLSKK